jgi:hypothetical protein
VVAVGAVEIAVVAHCDQDGGVDSVEEEVGVEGERVVGLTTWTIGIVTEMVTALK